MISSINRVTSKKSAPRVPVYLAAADTLAEQIADQPVGTWLPSEDELAGQLGVSRMTARAALAELERRYLVRRRQGSGTYVSRRVDYTISRRHPPSWSQSVRDAGLTPDVRTTGWRLETPSPEVRRRMRMGPRRQVIALTRDRYIDNELVGFAESFFDTELVPDLPQVLDPSSCTLADHYGLNRFADGSALPSTPQRPVEHLGLSGRPPVISIRSQTNAAARDHRPWNSRSRGCGSMYSRRDRLRQIRL